MKRHLAILALLFLSGPAAAQGSLPPRLTLREAARLAVAHHPELRAAASRVESARAGFDRSQAPFYPALDGSFRWSHSEASGTSTTGLAVSRAGSVDLYSAGVAGRLTLADFGKRGHRSRAAEATLQAAQDDYQEALQQLLLAVAEAYFQVLREARSVEIQQENVRHAEERLRQAVGFYEAGTRARIEVTRAQADLASARVELIRAQNALNRARVALGTAMGLEGSWERPLEDAELPPAGWTVEEAYRRALEARPDVAAARHRVRSARAGLEAARSEYWPEVSASSGFSYSDRLFPPEQSSWNVGVQVSFPILSHPTLSAGVDEARAALEEARAREEALLLTVRREVTDGVLNTTEAKERLEAARAGVRAAEENFRLASERYRVGVGSPLEVSEAQRLLVEARSEEAQAHFDLQVARARLYRSAGVLGLEVLP